MGLCVVGMFTLPFSVGGLGLAIHAWREQDRGVITVIALVLNGVAVLVGVGMIVLRLAARRYL
jgi:hypothetical protein